MSLRDRCQRMIDTLNRNAMLRQGSPADDLEAFVLAERGREHVVETCAPLVLYFTDKAEREEFIALWKERSPQQHHAQGALMDVESFIAGFMTAVAIGSVVRLIIVWRR